jgi:hypothetical protein
MKIGIWPYDGFDLTYKEEDGESQLIGLNFETLWECLYAKHCFDSFLTEDLPIEEPKITEHEEDVMIEQAYGPDRLGKMKTVEMVFYHETLRYVYSVNELERTSSVTVDHNTARTTSDSRPANKKASRAQEKGLRAV